MIKHTLVALLTRNGLPDEADLSFLKSEVEGIIGGSYRRMSFGRETIQFDYAGPFTGPIEGCNPGDNTLSKIAEYGIRCAYEAGVDVASYRSFVFLRHDDFPWDERFNSGEGG